jgi:hypothetical protein
MRADAEIDHSGYISHLNRESPCLKESHRAFSTVPAPMNNANNWPVSCRSASSVWYPVKISIWTALTMLRRNYSSGQIGPLRNVAKAMWGLMVSSSQLFSSRRPILHERAITFGSGNSRKRTRNAMPRNWMSEREAFPIPVGNATCRCHRLQIIQLYCSYTESAHHLKNRRGSVFPTDRTHEDAD